MRYDLVIIGAGPAGMAAAINAHKLGLKFKILDEQSQPGGQIYRNIENNINLGETCNQLKDILGTDYYAGSGLYNDFKELPDVYISGAVVWQVEAGRLYYSKAGKGYSIQAEHVLIANGALERPFPILGWTLPGVMTAGSAQILLKNPALAVEDAVFAGSGPLFYLIISQYLKAGIKVKAILDTTPTINYFNALKELFSALKGTGYLLKGLKLIREIKASDTLFIKGVNMLEAHCGTEDQLTAVSYTVGNKTSSIETRQLFLHQGIVPNVNLAMASNCQHFWSEKQLCWQPQLDKWGQSSQQHISITGDGSAILGAIGSRLQGAIAVQNIAVVLNKISASQRDINTHKLFVQLKREQDFRPFLDTLYRPLDSLRKPVHKETIVCRCEEVKVADVEQAISNGCMGPNQLKSFTRAGMGSCQGRQCGLTISELTASLTKQSVADTGYYRIRAPIKPVTLAELASLHQPNDVIDSS